MIAAVRGTSAPSALRCALTAGFAIATLLFASGVFAASSEAAFKHVPGPTFQFKTLPGPAPGFVAVDEATDSVYVQASGGANSGDIEKFDAEGNPSNFSALGTNVIDTTCTGFCFQIAVDNTGGPNQGTIYVATTGDPSSAQAATQAGIHVYRPDGTYVGVNLVRSGPSTGHCGVGVDPSGDLIVAHGGNIPGNSYFDKFETPVWATDPDLSPPIKGTILSDHANSCRFEVDPNGTIFGVAPASSNPANPGVIREYRADAFQVNPNPSGEIAQVSVPSRLVNTGQYADVAVDDEAHLFGLHSLPASGIEKFDSGNDTLIETFGKGSTLTPGYIARNDSTDTAYVTDRSTNVAAKDVQIFTTVVVPDSLTGAFSPVTAASGTLDAEVDPDGAGDITSCQFDVVTEGKYTINGFADATAVPCDQATPISSGGEVTADVSGLKLEEPHRFRVRTENANGVSNGTSRRFVPHAVVGLETGDATEVAPRSATLHAGFVGDGTDTEYAFEYGTTAGLGMTSEVKEIPAAAGNQGVEIGIDELELETTYHYRVTATNSTGVSRGEIETFTTPPAVAGVATGLASDIGNDGITLNGEFLGEGLDTTYYFEYGLTTAYGMLSEEPPGSPAGSSVGAIPVSSTITDYQGFKTYHYRLVAKNHFGETRGPDQTFTTPAAPPPVVFPGSASAIGRTTATLTAQVNANRWPTSYLFEWGASTDYGSETGRDQVIGGLDTVARTVSAQIDGLTPGTVYHYRIVALNLTGVANGPDQTFITPDLPAVESSATTGNGADGARLTALVAAKGSPTSVTFEYGPTAAYGSTTAAQAIGSDLLFRPVNAEVGGLAAGTTYHFRVVATNAFGTSHGPDMVLTTPIAPPPPPQRDCSALDRRAKAAAKRAKAKRRQAAKTTAKRARGLRKQAGKAQKQTRKLRAKATACRKAGGSR